MKHSTALARHCELDPSCIDGIDYVDGDEVLALVWCATHETYHWKWVPQFWMGRSPL